MVNVMRDMMLIIKGNFRKNKGAYIAVFILMFIVSVCFVSVISVVRNTHKHNKKAMEDTGLGDMLIWCAEYNITDFNEAKKELSNRLENCDAISEVKAIDQIETYITDINGKEYGNTVFLTNCDSDLVSYKIFDGDGNPVTDPELNSREVIVPISFTTMFNVDIGDTFTIGRADYKIDVTIKYFFEDPYMGTQIMGVKTLLISDADFAYIRENYKDANIAFADSVLFSLKKKDSDMSDVKFEKQINKDTNVSSYGWVSLTKTQSAYYMMLLLDIFSGILVGFIVLLVIIAIIVLGHNISNSIEKDYVNYGIYKAIGITSNKLKMSILIGYTLTCILGFAVGMPVALPVIKVVNEILRPIGGTYVETSFDIGMSLLAMLAILLVVGLYIMLKVSKISRVTPVSALNEGRADVHFSSVLRLPLSKKLLNTSLAYRQLISRKKQYISAVIITALLVVFMVLINQSLSWLSGGDEKIMSALFDPISYDLSISGETSDELEAKKKEINELVESISGYKEVHLMSKYVLLDDTKIHCLIIDDPEAVFNLHKGRTCLYDDEILLTDYLSRELGKGIGDTVTIGDLDEKQEYIVVGLTYTGNDAGKSFTMNYKGYERLNKDVKWTWRVGYYSIDDESKIEKIVDSINEKYGEFGITAKEYGNDVDGDPISLALNGISVVIYVLSAIFIIITVILVSGKMFEREKKDYGILKACGFDSGKLRSQFALRFMFASFVGSLLGIIIAIISGERIMELIFSMFGILHLEFSFGAPALIIPVCVMALMFYVFAYLVSGKIKKVNTRVLVVE